MGRIFERRPGQNQWLIGNDAGAQQDNGQHADKKIMEPCYKENKS